MATEVYLEPPYHVPRGDVRMQSTPWGWIFYGTREALLAIAPVHLADFPGQPPHGKRTSRFTRDGRDMKLYQRSTRGFELWVSRTADEEAEEDRIKQDRQVRAAVDEAVRRISPSHADYRARCVQGASAVLSSVRGVLTGQLGDLGGYHYARETIEAFDDLVSEILELLKDGTTRLDQAKHEAQIAKATAPLVKLDSRFQEFLRKTIEARECP